MIRKVVPIPSISKPILEEDEEEDDEENAPLNRRTMLAKSIKQERKRSSMVMPPSIPREPLQSSTLEDEM